jgi:two-component system cell cycle sensor histidine kinase/response regulator CckA
MSERATAAKPPGGMNSAHSLLLRQLEQHFGKGFEIPGPWRAFVDAVGQTYGNFDADRGMLERCLELSSHELYRANSEMRAVFGAIPDMLFRLHENGMILDFKAGTSSDLSLPPSEAIGKQLKTALVEHSPWLEDAIAQVSTTKNVASVEYSLRKSDQISFYEARLAPVLDNQVIVIVRNITERKRAQDELFSSRQMLRSILDTIPQRVFWKDVDSVYLGCNKPLAQDAGYADPNEIVGKTDYDTASAATADQYRADDLRVIQSGRAKLNYEEPQVAADGSPRWLRTSKVPLFDKDGNPIGLLGTYEDITERKNVEEALRSAEERFRYMALATRDAIYDCDLRNGSVWHNETYQTLYCGKESVPADEKWWADRIHPDDRKRILDSLTAALEARRELWSDEYRFHRCDGNYSTVIDRRYTFYDEHGKPDRLIGAMTDISERKRLEEQFLQAQKMEAFGQLAGGIAHDFNNLLTVIQGNLSFVRTGQLSPGEQTSALDESFRATERAANLTRQLLTFSRRQPIQPKDIDLNEVVATMTKMFQRLIGEHITLENRYSSGGAPIHADPGMMEQALMNLVVNSRDAMHKGGRLVIETQTIVLTERDTRADPRARTGEFVRLTVSDTGSGISPEHLPHIFEPFYTTKEVGKGTGLGLATVFGIVEQHRGWISVESQVGAGTTFHLYLPRLGKPSALQGKGGGLRVSMPTGHETVLLVEDETEVRRLMLRLLERHGYRVYAAVSGAAALDVWAQHRDQIALVVTDIVMPGGLSGREMIERFRNDRPDLKVIYCSGYSDEVLGTASPFRATANFLEKPFGVGVFLQRVRECLDTR